MMGHATYEHDLWLVFLSVAMCVAGGWATSRFTPRLVAERGVTRWGWIVLTATVAGVSIWCTHFVAMLGFQGAALVSLDQGLTVLSLVVSVVGAGLGLALATVRPSKVLAVVGGVVLGGSIVGLHYIGVAAYRVAGTVSWNIGLVALSVLFSVVLSIGAMLAIHTGPHPRRNTLWALLVLAVLLLHFTGMAAFHVAAHQHGEEGATSGSLQMFAVFIAVLGFVAMASGIAGYLIDDRTRAESYERFRTLALYDLLTTLPNRAHFTEHLDRELALAEAHGREFGLVGIDVNNFKEINDMRGHAAGDEVLRVIGGRLADLTLGREESFIARVGGDEFTATVRLGDGGSLDAFLDDLDRALTSPVSLHDGADEIQPRAAVGIAMYPKDGTSAEEFIANADLAMYRSKADPVRGPRFYDQAQDAHTRARRLLGADLRDALSRNELHLRYQLQVDVETGKPMGYEALVRWDHPRFGTVLPGEFIPIAEENGLILPIGEWVLRTACATAAEWEPRYRIAVNVSAVQLAQPGLVEFVRDVLDVTGLEPERLELELTETAVFSDRERALATICAIKELGVRIALDDFGTGYSSLEVLRSFPFDRLKIDRSIFRVTTESELRQAREIVHVISGFGRTLGMTVLAEGIETDEQFEILRGTGVSEAQGYLLGYPALLQDIVDTGQISVGGRVDPAPEIGARGGPSCPVASTSTAPRSPIPAPRSTRADPGPSVTTAHSASEL